jgi:hypothetical protein
MGFLFGATIPTGYRKILRQTGAEHSGDLTRPTLSVGTTIGSGVANVQAACQPSAGAKDELAVCPTVL